MLVLFFVNFNILFKLDQKEFEKETDNYCPVCTDRVNGSWHFCQICNMQVHAYCLDKETHKVCSNLHTSSPVTKKRKKNPEPEKDGWKRYVKCPTSVLRVEKVSDDASESSGEESSVGEEEKNESVVVPHSPPRRDFTMSTASTLQKLTEGDSLEDGEESEWLIIKVPKEMQQEGELFLVDYVDGDTEDE